ncbi:MAG: TonB-dependent receptor, partial [Acidobacteriota bacterium]|nr:TonB-dependent receptor [Acidobacteriota bacterium]
MSIRTRFALGWLYLILLFAPTLQAQVVNATLIGIVTDPSGATVAGARVTAINTGTNVAHEAQADSDGVYTIPALAPGEYRLEVAQPGFKKQLLSGIVLQVAQEARVNVTLQVGELSESVTVASSAPLVNSENATVGSVINEKRVVDLPLNGRNFMQLTLLTGGIDEGGSSNAKGGILNRGFAPSAAGMPAAENSYLLDGADNTEAFFKTYNVSLSVDAVQEFRIQIGQYSAEYGAGGGAVVNVVTKSGSNQFHGAAWEFVRNNIFDARNFFLRPNQDIAALHQNQFGVAAGGPVIHNKTFFFGDFDLTRISQGQFASGNVPTDAQRSGNLSSINKVIKDPLTGLQFPGNVIPPNRISSISAALIKYYPEPNVTSATQNFSNNLALRNNSDNYLLKIDHNFSARENLTGRYASQSNDKYAPLVFPTIGGQKQPQRFQNAVLSLTSAFSPTLLNEAHFSYSRTVNRTQGQNTGNPIAAQAGIPFAPTSGSNSGFPESIGIGTSSISGLSEGQPWFLTVNTFQWYDGITWVHGSHTVKAGVDIRRIRADALIATHENNGYTFSGQFTGDGFADFLLGIPSTETLVLAPNQQGRFRTTSQAYYVLDDWKVTPSFTLNIGMRYEYYAPPVELSGLTPIFDTALGGLRFPKQNTTALPFYQTNRPDLPVGKLDRNSEFTPDKNNFAPRFGFAWRPFNNEKTVVRGGYGWYYSSPPTINLVQNAQTGPPSQFWATYSAPVNTPSLNYGGPIGVSPDQALKTATFGLLSGPEGHFLNAYNQQWSISIARQVGRTWSFEGQYLGSKATHLYNLFDYNTTTPGTSALATRVPYPKWARIFGFSSGANANYNALILSAEKRLSHGLTFKSAYTYSKALTRLGGIEASGTNAAVQNPLNLSAEGGPTADDVPHRFVGTFSYELPFGSGKLIGGSSHGFVDKVIGGWWLSGIITAADGLFFSPTIGTQNCNSGFQITCRPDLLANPALGVSGVDSPRWSIAAFDWPNNTTRHPAQAPRFGNAGPNTLQGNGFQNFDLSVRKDIPVNERFR